ncbi:MAG: T9SS type A sorting domain-containing protein [Bacteroidales bacterium]|jgi:hypothetical protein|nr:T9SS type A sorting domain-containing protein [Bacteroidales bacterium]
MKTRIITLMMTLYSVFAIGQDTVYPPLFDRYLLPEQFIECLTHPLDSHSVKQSIHTGLNDGIAETMAQPYFIDAPVKIIGVSAFCSYNSVDLITQEHFGEEFANFFQIRDSTLNNVLASVRFDTIDQSKGGYASTQYTEVLFPTPIVVSANKFYVVVDMQAPHYEGAGFSLYAAVLDTNTCSLEERALARFWSAGTILDWRSAAEYPYQYLSIGTLYLFPILDTLEQPAIEIGNILIDNPNHTVSVPINVMEYGFPFPADIGVVYDTDSNLLDITNPNIIHINFDTSQNAYNVLLPYDSLDCNTTYYCRAFITNDIQTTYGNIKDFNIMCSGLNDVENAVSATLYPNPADNELNITTSIPMTNIEISNSAGQKVYTMNLKSTTASIKIEHLASGIYFVDIITSKGSIKKTFVKK